MATANGNGAIMKFLMTLAAAFVIGCVGVLYGFGQMSSRQNEIEKRQDRKDARDVERDRKMFAELMEIRNKLDLALKERK